MRSLHRKPSKLEMSMVLTVGYAPHLALFMIIWWSNKNIFSLAVALGDAFSSRNRVPKFPSTFFAILSILAYLTEIYRTRNAFEGPTLVTNSDIVSSFTLLEFIYSCAEILHHIQHITTKALLADIEAAWGEFLA